MRLGLAGSDTEVGGHLGPRAAGFVVERWIAAGSSGTVWRAVHVKTGAPAAIKVMHPELAASVGAVARFNLEIAVIQRVGHPGGR